MCLTSHGVDSSYHMQTNMGVRKGNVWGISVHSINKGEVLFVFVMNIWRGYSFFTLKVDVLKGALRFRELIDTTCVSIIQLMFSLLSYGNNAQWYFVHSW